MFYCWHLGGARATGSLTLRMDHKPQQAPVGSLTAVHAATLSTCRAWKASRDATRVRSQPVRRGSGRSRVARRRAASKRYHDDTAVSLLASPASFRRMEKVRMGNRSFPSRRWMPCRSTHGTMLACKHRVPPAARARGSRSSPPSCIRFQGCTYARAASRPHRTRRQHALARPMVCLM
jgi:hypothetical protein